MHDNLQYKKVLLQRLSLTFSPTYLIMELSYDMICSCLVSMHLIISTQNKDGHLARCQNQGVWWRLCLALGHVTFSFYEVITVSDNSAWECLD